MKTILLVLACLVLATQAQQQLMLTSPRTSGTSTSYVLKDSQSTSNAILGIGANSNNNEYGSSAWVAGSSYTLTRLSVFLRRNGTGTNAVISAFIYSDSANKPSTLLATSSTTYYHSNLPSAGALKTFDFSGQSLTNGTRYHMVVFQNPAYSFQNTYVAYDNTTAINGIYKSPDASTWTGIDFSAQAAFETYAE
jgi:hypothetical protein